MSVSHNRFHANPALFCFLLGTVLVATGAGGEASGVATYEKWMANCGEFSGGRFVAERTIIDEVFRHPDVSTLSVLWKSREDVLAKFGSSKERRMYSDEIWWKNGAVFARTSQAHGEFTQVPDELIKLAGLERPFGLLGEAIIGRSLVEIRKRFNVVSADVRGSPAVELKPIQELEAKRINSIKLFFDSKTGDLVSISVQEAVPNRRIDLRITLYEWIKPAM